MVKTAGFRRLEKSFIRILGMILLLLLIAPTICHAAAEEESEFNLLREKAHAGDPAAQFKLGNLYFYGSDSVKSSPELAVYWYKKAAAQGIPEAQFNYGLCLEEGFGTEKNMIEAIHYYDLSGEQGFVPALYRKAMLLIHGEPRTPEMLKGMTPEEIQRVNSFMNPSEGAALLEKILEKTDLPEGKIELCDYLLKTLPEDISEREKLCTRIYTLLREAEAAGSG